MTDSDKQLLGAMAANNQQAFNTFYNRYHKIVLQQINSRLENKEAAKDLVQDFWVTVLTHPDIIKTNDEGSAMGFMRYYISIRVLHYFRTRRKGSVAIDELPEGRLNTPLNYTHVFEELEESEIELFIDSILDTLPKMSRNIYVLCQRKACTYNEVATILSTTENTVRTKYSLTMKIIRLRLAELYSRKSPKTVLILLYCYLRLFCL